MARFAFHPQSSTSYYLQRTKAWTPSLSIWGFGAGTAALFVLSVTPLVKREVLVKVPLIGDYWADNTPASDKPF